ncbi:L-histidine N(alpha)-methyltransferase [Betaproteobacteria bacterium GR16-43]|nr:L-histidine N(alpha)-methyltransferase [Betaproteobacteria bacterium GR16-43]
MHRTPAIEHDERADVIAGLLANPARVSPKYFYDELGCALYGAICQLPEYYPTRTEIALFREHRAEIAEAVGQGGQFIDLGAGDCCKAEGWLPFVNPKRYLAVDIAGPEVERSLARMAPDFPEIEMVGVVTDFSRKLDLDGLLERGPVTFFYPGSSIGNFTPTEARVFLSGVRRYFDGRPGSGLLIGVDGKKEKARLDAAYDDALGVTAAFNRNALLHLNSKFGFDFVLDGFVHRGFYNEPQGRVEMHLEAVRDQTVRLGNRVRPFAKGERIHTENSYKYQPETFVALLKEAGFASGRTWTSPGGEYSVYFAA